MIEFLFDISTVTTALLFSFRKYNVQKAMRLKYTQSVKRWIVNHVSINI